MRESVPNYLIFDEKAKETFSFLVDNLKYKLIETIAKDNYVRHTYRNRWRGRKIVLENQTWQVDYGFGFFVYNLWAKKHCVIHNVPWKKQDSECMFLNDTKKLITENVDIIALIRGRKWEIKGSR